MIFDSHAHYDDPVFDQDRHQLLENLKNKNVCAVVNCSADLRQSIASINLSQKYDFVFAAIGVHPHEAAKVEKDYLGQLEKLSKNQKVVAIGEIGLDYHYDFSPRDVQLNVFEQQLILALDLDLPVIIHDRDAHNDTLNLLKKYRPKGVVHCFSGSVQMAKDVIDLGLYIGLGGAVTFKNAKNPVLVAQSIPLERMLLETDAPYMTPVPFRGTRCDSSLIDYTAQKISEVRGCSKEQILQVTKTNSEKLFKVTLTS